MREKNKLFDELLELSAKVKEITLTDDIQNCLAMSILVQMAV